NGRSTLNDVGRIGTKRAARADIVARFFGLALTLPDLAERDRGNVTRLAMIVGVLRYRAPCHGKPDVSSATVRRRHACDRLYDLCRLAAKPDQFRAPFLR